jgi:outer membrane protein TolC
MTTRSVRGNRPQATRPPCRAEPVSKRPAGASGLPLTVVAAALLLGGCAAVGPDFKRPEVPWLPGWSGGSLVSLNAEQRGKARAQTEEWWRNFNDPVLDQLIAEAQRVNPNVRTAGMRILEARAQLMIAGSLLYPQQQQLTGKVLRTGEERSSGPDSTLTAYNASALRSAGKSISGASSGAASRPPMPATSPASPSTTICRC